MRIAVLAFVLLAVPAEASQSCKTKSEARTAWPRSYIAYRSLRGKRCWFSPGAATPKAQQAMAMEHPKLPLPNWIVMPSTWDRAIWYPAGWEQELPPGTTIYSTFDGEPPEIWP